MVIMSEKGKMRNCIILCLILVAVGAIPNEHKRIHGGSITTINNYPSMGAILDNRHGPGFFIWCGSTIINNRSVLTAAHCTDGARPGSQMIRVGSTVFHSGGVTHHVSAYIVHPNYNVTSFMDSEVAIIRIEGSFTFNDLVQAGQIAGPNYVAPDNAVAWAAGWGTTELGGPSSELRHVQVFIIDQQTCRAIHGDRLTDNMLCSGDQQINGKGQCSGDSGGPLFHQGVVVGVTSWFSQCGSSSAPMVNVRVSNFAQWIVNNA